MLRVDNTVRTKGGYRNMPAEYRAIAISLLRARDGDFCWICNKRMKMKEMTIDHVIPVTNGGVSDGANVKLAHASCNSQRLRPHLKKTHCKRGHLRTDENLRVSGRTKSGTLIYGCRLCHNEARKERRKIAQG